MLNHFLEANRAELIERCSSKVALRPAPHDTTIGLAHGVPLFLAQVIDALSRGNGAPTAINASAKKHGEEMMRRGFTIDQVVRDYGDLCQAITELAAESGTPISAGDFQVLNRCLDDAIADAITEFQAQRDRQVRARGRRDEADRIAEIAHELRGLLGTAALAFRALKGGKVGTSGATSAVLDRSLCAMVDMMARTVAEVRLDAGISARFESIRLDRFIADAQAAASLSADARECELEVSPVESTLHLLGDEQLLHSAVSNLLANAFKLTPRHGHVGLKAFAANDRILIEVRDRCGGGPAGKSEAPCTSLEQHGVDRSGPGLSIARRAVEAMAGSLRMTDLPGSEFVFTIELPRQLTGPGTIRRCATGG
jgi:signal transduction histidine kinase